MAAFAEVSDVTLANGATAAGPETVVQRELNVASARLRRLIPSLEPRLVGNEDLALLTTETVVQAVLRRLRNNGQGVAEVSAVTRSAGPFSETTNFRGPRNDFFTFEELALLRPPQEALGFGSIRLGLPDYGGASPRTVDAR
jgi:hypothetical protein